MFSIAATACATASPTVAVVVVGIGDARAPGQLGSHRGPSGFEIATGEVEAAEAGGASRVHERPDDTHPVAQADGEVSDATCAQPVDDSGLGCLVGENDQIGACPPRRRSRDGAGKQTTDSGLGGGEPLAAAVGVDVAGADVGAAHRAAGVGVHGAHAAVEQTGDDADRERAAPAHADHAHRARSGHPRRPARVDQRTRLDQLPEQAARDLGRNPVRRGLGDQSGGGGRPIQPIEQRGEWRRQTIDDERGLGVEADDPGICTERKNAAVTSQLHGGGQSLRLRGGAAGAAVTGGTGAMTPMMRRRTDSRQRLSTTAAKPVDDSSRDRGVDYGWNDGAPRGRRGPTQ